MNQLTFSGAFVTFLAVVGPPKVLLSFADIARPRTTRELHRLALVSSAIAAFVGLLADFSAPVLLGLFHITTAALQLAGGVIFFIYAVGLVLGLHLGTRPHDEGPTLVAGLRELLLPYVVSPLAMTAVILEAVQRSGWGWRGTVALAYVIVIAIDLVCILALTRVLQYTHHATIELLARLLGLLLAAVGVDLFLDGLGTLGVPLPAREH